MENHTFSDPIPFPESPIQPCWKVEVLRRGVGEPVACLDVHPQNFPPRKGKKNKILWKLPDSLADTPRFGGLEKERLWELFKTEKKNRRRSKQKRGDDAENIGGELNGATDVADPSSEFALSNGVGPTTKEPAEVNNQTAEPAQAPPAPPPPPGFGVSGLTLKESPPEKEEEATKGKPGEAAATKSPPRPPPGLAKVQSQQPQQHPVSPPPNLQKRPAPPGLSPASTAPQNVLHPLSFVFGALRASEIRTLPPASLSSVVGGHVAQTLIHALTTPGKLHVWLSHYHPNAQKLLLFGTAQAVAQTATDRQQQWESLIPPPPTDAAPPATTAAWDCQGWGVQSIAEPQSPSTGQSNGGNHVGDTSQGLSLLVVLMGRTLQRQEVLTYHLTLTLRSVDQPPRPLPPPLPGQHVPTQFQIHNEILSLARSA